jgi:ferric enterobactin receptor
MKNAFAQFCFALFLSLFAPNFIAAQTTVKGKIQDTKNQPVAFANVLLLKAKDSSLVKGAISDDAGLWAIDAVEKGSYLVKIQQMGFTTYQSTPLSIAAEKTVDVPMISLQEASNELAAVEVTYKKPFLEQRAGRMVVNVAESIGASAGTLGNVLRKVPGLLVVNNQVQMVGRPSVSIMIDGRPSTYMDMDALLRDFPAENIDRIEVISQPDASFDAAGAGGIINIILKKNIKLGTNGSVSVMGGRGDLPKSRLAANVSHRDKGVNLNFGANIGNWQGWDDMSLTRKIDDLTYQQRTYQPTNVKYANLRGGLDYYIDKRQTVGIGANGGLSNNYRVNTNITDIFRADGTTLRRLNADNDLRRDANYINGEAFYRFEIDTTGRKLEWSANFNRYNRDATSSLATKIVSGENFNYPTRRNLETGKTQIMATRVDYTHPLSKNATFTMGAKVSRADLDNDIQSSVLKNSEYVNDKGITNHYLYTEDIAAAYLNSTVKFGKIEWLAGVRYEHTKAKGYSITLDSTLTRDYGNFFPSTSVSIPFAKLMGKQVAAMAAYSYRINRPSYGSLNPFVSFLDPYTYQRGNPTLKPEFAHSTKLSLTADGQPFFNLEYNQTNDAIQMITEQDNKTGISYGFDENLARIRQYGGSLFLPLFGLKGLDGYAGTMIYYNEYKSKLFGDVLNQNAMSYTAFLQATYKINKNWKTELSGWYNGGGLRGLMRQGNMYGMDFGLNGKLWKDKLEMDLSVDNFLMRAFNGSINYLNQNIQIGNAWEPRVVTLTLKYKFGNQFFKDVKKAKSSAEEEARRANTKN